MAYYVYFISDGEYLKIGISNDVDKRLKTLQTSNARLLNLVHCIEVPNKDYAIWIENTLHGAFPHARAMGEWFRIDWKHVVVCADNLASNIESVRLTQKLNALVAKDIAENYPEMRHTANYVTFNEAIIEYNNRRRQQILDDVARELNTIRMNTIFKKA